MITYSQGNAFGNHQQVWVDKQTGVNYLYITRGGYAGGLTPPAESRRNPGGDPGFPVRRIICCAPGF